MRNLLILAVLWSSPALIVGQIAISLGGLAGPAVVLPKCGCPYTADSRHTAYLSGKLFVQHTADNACVLQCEKGYRLARMKNGVSTPMSSAQCVNGKWWDVKADLDNLSYDEAFDGMLSCEPAAPSCSVTTGLDPFTAVACNVTQTCDPSKMTFTPGAKSTCILKCDKGYRLVAPGSAPVLEAYFKGSQWGVKLLGSTQSTAYWRSLSVYINCEKYLTPEEQTQVVNPAVPTAPLPTCGCPYTADVKNPAYVPSKLFVQHTADNSCVMQCEKGYRLARVKNNVNTPMSTVQCIDGKWWDVKADLDNLSYEENFDGAFSCEPAAPSCTTVPGQEPFTPAACNATQICDPSKMTSVPGAKSTCILKCDQGYRLMTPNSTPLLEVYFKSVQWAIKKIGAAKSTSYYVSLTANVNCEKILTPAELEQLKNQATTTTTTAAPTTTKAATTTSTTAATTTTTKAATTTVAPTTTTTAKPTTTAPAISITTLFFAPPFSCGCAFKVDSRINTYDHTKMFLQDTGTGKCVVACDNGYRLARAIADGSTYTSIALSSIKCINNVWWDVKADKDNVMDEEVFDGRFSCEPSTATCTGPSGGLPHTIAACDSKTECDSSKIRYIAGKKSTCIVNCGRGYTLYIGTPNIAEASLSTVSNRWSYKFTTNSRTSATINSNTMGINCQRYLAPSETAATAHTTCGCSFEYFTTGACANNACDATQLNSQHDGAGSCSLWCNFGYELTSDVASATTTVAVCYAYEWFGRSGSTSKALNNLSPKISCKKIAPKYCFSSTSNDFNLMTCGTCDSKVDKTISSPLQCTHVCGAGYRLLGSDANTYSSAKRFAEISYDNNQFYGMLTTGQMVSYKKLFYNCEKYTPLPLAQCTCPYTKQEGSGYDYTKLQNRLVYPESNNCELICAPGYVLVKDGQDIAVAMCQNGEWIGRDYAMKINMYLGKNPAITCRKIDSYTCKGAFSAYTCATCNQKMLLPMPTGTDCQMTCRAGYRLVVKTPTGTVTRPRLVYLKGLTWYSSGGYGLQVEASLGNAPLIGCEVDSYPPISDAATTAAPLKPCEQCSGLSTVSTCPSGKSCNTKYYTIFYTSDGCLQARCAIARTMLINKNGAFTGQTTKALTCNKDKAWVLNGTSTVLGTSVAFTCDANTAGTKSLEETVYELAISGKSLLALDPNFVSSYNGWNGIS